MDTGPKIAQVAALVGDPARANMLSALMDGRTLTATELAYVSGVAPQTASGHLARLSDAGLLALERPAALPSRSPTGWPNCRLFSSTRMADN
jgi:DNA-binding transcriptional ArsR family regulator